MASTGEIKDCESCSPDVFVGKLECFGQSSMREELLYYSCGCSSGMSVRQGP